MKYSHLSRRGRVSPTVDVRIGFPGIQGIGGRFCPADPRSPSRTSSHAETGRTALAESPAPLQAGFRISARHAASCMRHGIPAADRQHTAIPGADGFCRSPVSSPGFCRAADRTPVRGKGSIPAERPSADPPRSRQTAPSPALPCSGCCRRPPDLPSEEWRDAAVYRIALHRTSGADRIVVQIAARDTAGNTTRSRGTRDHRPA